jgi:hypothetical protein
MFFQQATGIQVLILTKSIASSELWFRKLSRFVPPHSSLDFAMLEGRGDVLLSSMVNSRRNLTAV